MRGRSCGINLPEQVGWEKKGGFGGKVAGMGSCEQGKGRGDTQRKVPEDPGCGGKKRC